MRPITASLILFCLIIGLTHAAYAFDTESKDFSNLGNWKITAEHSEPMGERWCRAIGQFDGNDVTILQGQLLPLYGKLYLDVTMHQRALPQGYEDNANLLLDGVPSATGKLQDVGDWQGDKRTAFYARATFTKVEGLEDKLRKADKLTVQSDAKNFKAVELNGLELDRVMAELRRCLR